MRRNIKRIFTAVCVGVLVLILSYVRVDNSKDVNILGIPSTDNSKHVNILDIPSTDAIRQHFELDRNANKHSAKQISGTLKNNSSTSCLDQDGLIQMDYDMPIEKLNHIGIKQNKFVYYPRWQRRFGSSSKRGSAADGLLLDPWAPLRLYYLSAVVRLRLYKTDKAKLTIAELKQWLHYQFWAGTQHVYICYHFLNEEERIGAQVEKYIKLGLVTLYPWNDIPAVPGSPTYDGDNHKNQVGCYDYIRKRHGNETVWQYNMDMDEYPYTPKDKCEGFLTRYLDNMATNPTTRTVSQVLVRNFLLMGQGDRSRDIMIDRINRITPSEANNLVKPIYRVLDVQHAGMHSVVLKAGRVIYADPVKLKMLHYHGARYQDWGPDTDKMRHDTVEFNDVKDSIALYVRNSLVAFGEADAFNNSTGP